MQGYYDGQFGLALHASPAALVPSCYQPPQHVDISGVVKGKFVSPTKQWCNC